MSVEAIHQLSKKRKKWVEANRENDFEDGIKRLLTDLYPDNAHFIYELLQNAEDVKASEVQFVLNTDSIEFEHNGSQLFSISDVESITNIGKTTKKDDPTSIGKFGVGFKAVFAYTSTPEIKSGEYHFRIRDLVVPETEGLSPRTLDENRTHFLFPFDNPQKSPEKACSEIEKNLRQLGEGALLFLKNIRRIEYRLPDSKSGSLERIEKDGDRIEISVRRPESLEPDSAHYLRFEKVVDVSDEDEGNLESCRIAVAFGMENSKEQKWKIKPLDKGQVCIYFPAEKEISKLRFHLHAPFASTVARDSIRDCPANDELRDHIADLVAESMFAIRDQELLDVAFLAVLPNDKDNLSSFYQPIQEKLVEVFKNEKLTPMKRGGHASASGIYQGSRLLSGLINDGDLATILGKDQSLPLWAANAPQRYQEADNFLFSLEISKWGEENLIRELSEQPDLVKTWLKDKSDEWHQRFYALLGDFCACPRYASEYSKPRYRDRKDELSNLPIVRLSDGATYKKGKDCKFPSDDVEHDEKFPRVAKGVYSSGKNKDQQEEARKFLEEIGVSEVGEVDQVEAILKQRYTYEAEIPDTKQYIKDLKRFIKLVEDDLQWKDLFNRYYIFQSKDKKWRKPNGIFLDLPYLDTGLKAYYEALDSDTDRRWALSPKYKESGIELKKIGEFAKKVGAQTKLEDKEQKISIWHPKYDYLMSAPGQRIRNEIDEDYTIPAFEALFDKPNLDKARLIWRTMDSLPSIYLTAKYRKSKNKEFHYAESSLVYDLRNAEWVPQKCEEIQHMPDEATKRILAHDLGKIEWIPQKQGKILVIRFVRPCDASSELLPEDFSHHPRREWIRKVEFGENAKKKSEDHIALTRNAREMGFDNADEAKKWAELKKMGISPDEIRSKFISSPEFPTSSVNNPDRRQERLAEQLHDAPDKKYELKQRSVRTTEIDHRTYLKNQYTNDDDQMICQICNGEMPFKKRDGEYYFETVEALSKDYFPKEHEAQFLALCPECAARYKELVKKDEDAMKKVYNALKNSDEPEISLQLGELARSLQFVATHRQDIRTILKANSLAD